MRSCLDVTPDALPDIVRMLGLMQVKVVGSAANDSAVRLVIDGAVVPDAPLVTGIMDIVTGEHVSQFTCRFKPVE